MTIKRKFLKHGDVVEIPLTRLNKFAYGKLINPTKIKNPFDYPFFIRIYNSIHENRINDVTELNRELLLAPFWLIGQSAAVTKFNWTIITNEQVDSLEEFIPDSKRSWPPLDPNPTKWGYIKRFDTQIILSEFDKVKHLDESSGKNIEIVPFIIELEILKLEGRDIKREFGPLDWLEELFYKTHSILPIYLNLRDSMKGRAVE